MLNPFHIPFPIPRKLWDQWLRFLSLIRIIPPPRRFDPEDDDNGKVKPWVTLRFPMNIVTAPLIADLFLLAIQAIGSKEVYSGTIGANNISPIDIMAFFLTLAYIAISIDASGLIRYLAFKVLQWGGEVGHRLFFYLYAFFFLLGSFIGNDPIILSGTAFLAYMTRVSSNIVHPRAWIHTQFAIANIVSAILVSSNPTNLVLAGAFKIRFIYYTANMVVPVVCTAIVLFPFLLYIVFADDTLIPYSIKMHELPEEMRQRKPVNPNIPNARGTAEEQEDKNDEQGKLLSLEEIMNPFLDKFGAAVGGIIMAATLITLLAVNAANSDNRETHVFWVTLPAAFLMLCWDLGFGWWHRHETREIARAGREEVELARLEREEARRLAEEEGEEAVEGEEGGESDESGGENPVLMATSSKEAPTTSEKNAAMGDDDATLATDGAGTRPMPSPQLESSVSTLTPRPEPPVQNDRSSTSAMSALNEKPDSAGTEPELEPSPPGPAGGAANTEEIGNAEKIRAAALQRRASILEEEEGQGPEPTTVVSLGRRFYKWAQETFPTATTVLSHLPYALVPFAFAMFVLVQALVTKGWVPLFGYGWDHWVNKTGTIGAIGGMAFLSVVLCNVSPVS